MIREIESIRDNVPGFTGVISDLGGPTANMYRIACKSREIESACRRPSCVYPGICPNLNTDHAPLIKLYRGARELPGIKKVLIASGVRYDLAIESPEYVKELAQHHVGGYLKIAPEAIGEGPLSKMMKPGVGTYYRFKELFDRYSKEAGKEQYLIPYFIAAHPGTTDEDMLELALWLKQNGFRADQVQAFLPSPMATATAMYHSGKNPLRRVTRDERRGDRTEGPEGAPAAQGLPALSRREQLAGAARGAAAHGPRRSHRQRQASAGAGLSAGGHGRRARRQARRQRASAIPHAAHRAADYAGGEQALGRPKTARGLSRAAARGRQGARPAAGPCLNRPPAAGREHADQREPAGGPTLVAPYSAGARELRGPRSPRTDDERQAIASAEKGCCAGWRRATFGPIRAIGSRRSKRLGKWRHVRQRYRSFSAVGAPAAWPTSA